MKKTNLNKDLIKSFKEILKTTRGSGSGDKFEKMCEEIFKDNTGFKVVNAEAFKNYYPEYKKACGLIHRNSGNGLDFNFHNEKLSSGLDENDSLIVIQPNGSQSSPDILIIHNKIGIPIEIKSAKGNKVIWNSGYPRENYIYIFNSYKKEKDTTIFMGQDLIDPEVRNILLGVAEENKSIANRTNKKLRERGSGWSLYARPMFEYCPDYFEPDYRFQREANVFKFLDGLDL